MEAPPQRGISRSLIAAALGAIVMAAAVVGISLNADAGSTNNNADQASAAATTPPTTDAPEDVPAEPVTTTVVFDEEAMEDAYHEDYGEYEQCMQESGVYDEPLEPFDEEDYEAMDALFAEADAECSLLLPEEIQIENAAWKAHSECVEEILGSDFWESEQAVDEDAYTEADRECRSVLPEHIQEELAAWDAHSDCTREFLGDDYYGEEGSETVSYSTMEDYASYILGEGDSTITITKVDGEVTVTVDGDVIVQDEDYWQAEEARWTEAERACEHLMPEYSEG